MKYKNEDFIKSILHRNWLIEMTPAWAMLSKVHKQTCYMSDAWSKPLCGYKNSNLLLKCIIVIRSSIYPCILSHSLRDNTECKKIEIWIITTGTNILVILNVETAIKEEAIPHNPVKPFISLIVSP